MELLLRISFKNPYSEFRFSIKRCALAFRIQPYSRPIYIFIFQHDIALNLLNLILYKCNFSIA
jgi:hypothetical protein